MTFFKTKTANIENIISNYIPLFSNHWVCVYWNFWWISSAFTPTFRLGSLGLSRLPIIRKKRAKAEAQSSEDSPCPILSSHIYSILSLCGDRTDGPSQTKTKMPELPEVEAARRAIEEQCVGKKIKRSVVANDSKVIDGVSASDFEAALSGKTLVAAHRKGKNLWLQLDSPPFPIFQFGTFLSLYI